MQTLLFVEEFIVKFPRSKFQEVPLDRRVLVYNNRLLINIFPIH